MDRQFSQLRTDQWIVAFAGRDARALLLLWLALFSFFLLTAAGNLGETDDVYAFAYRAEHFAADHISDPRLMLYHMLMRGLYLAASLLNSDISALSLMRGFSALCAAAVLPLLLRILLIDFRLTPVCGVVATAMLACSYGFWRYAAEAEVYIPATLLCLLIFHLLAAQSAQTARVSRYLWLGGMAGLTVLFYQPSVIPLYFAFPLLLLLRRHYTGFVVYCAAGGLVTTGGYLLGYLLYWNEPFSLPALIAFLSQRSQEFMVPSLSLRTVIVSIIRSALALGHDIASANWLFGFDPVVQGIQRAFSSNEIAEEVFLAQGAGNRIFLPILTLAVLIITAVRMLCLCWPFPLVRFRDPRLLTVLVWVLVNGAIIGRLNPAGIEAWIMLLAPLLILIAALIIDPYISKRGMASPAVLLSTLFIHNWIGGMALVSSSETELDRVKSRWVIEEGNARDLVIVTDNAGLSETLRYLAPARVALVRSSDVPDLVTLLLDRSLVFPWLKTYGRDFGGQELHSLIKNTWLNGGRVILFDEFFRPETSTSIRLLLTDPGTAEHLLQRLKAKVQRVYDAGAVGETFVLSSEAIESGKDS